MELGWCNPLMRQWQQLTKERVIGARKHTTFLSLTGDEAFVAGGRFASQCGAKHQ
jgi:hypothetical protein